MTCEMHYIRFLKTPKLSGRGASALSVRVVLTLATDLGDDFFYGDMDLVVTVARVASPTSVIAHKDVFWQRGNRAVPVDVDLDPSFQLSAFRVFVDCQDPVYEKSNTNDHSFIMPVVFPVASTVIDPSRGALEAEKLALRTLSFSHEKAVSIYEDTGESIARHIWDAGVALSFHIDRSLSFAPTALPSLDRCLATARNSKLNVIELGTGCGLVGLALQAMIRNCQVLLTDVEDGASLNIPSTADNVSYCNLDWSCSLPVETLNNRFGLIVAADCTYNPDSSPHLVRTISELKKRSSDALVVVASKTRHSSEAIFFELMAKEMFLIEDETSVLAPGGCAEQDLEDGEKIGIYTFTKNTI